jgi:hypothetical protein
MNDQELRDMIRASIARHLGATSDDGTVRPFENLRAPLSGVEGRLKADTTYGSAHASHLRFPLRSGDEDGACVIEPSVRCNHCGYCLSMGH